MRLPDVGLDCRASAGKYDGEFDLFSCQSVDEAAADADESVDCDEWVMGAEARASHLSLASAVRGVRASIRECMKLLVKSFSLDCRENRNLCFS